VRLINRRIITRVIVVAGFTAASLLLSSRLAPEPSYLPSGNQNLIFGMIFTPPGYNTPEFERIAERLEEGNPAKGLIGIRSFWEVDEGTPEYEKLLAEWSQMVEGSVVPRLEGALAAAREQAKDKDATSKQRAKAKQLIREKKREIAEWRVPPPPIDNFFYVAWGGGCFMGCSSKNPDLVKPLENVLNATGFSVPDSMAFFAQTSIFGDLGAGNSVEIEIRGQHHDRLSPEVRQGATQSGQLRPRPAGGSVDPRSRPGR
jgi:HAE1 family hydrophobic/amphiphilic exporter-1